MAGNDLAVAVSAKIKKTKLKNYMKTRAALSKLVKSAEEYYRLGGQNTRKELFTDIKMAEKALQQPLVSGELPDTDMFYRQFKMLTKHEFDVWWQTVIGNLR